MPRQNGTICLGRMILNLSLKAHLPQPPVPLLKRLAQMILAVQPHRPHLPQQPAPLLKRLAQMILAVQTHRPLIPSLCTPSSPQRLRHPMQGP